MVLSLLRPLVLSYKNKFLRRTAGGHLFSIEFVVLALSVLVMGGIYWSSHSFLVQLTEASEFVGLIPAAMVRLGLSLFFFLLILSSFITALSVFFEAQDLRLYLGAPISSWQIYAARFLETVVNSSWMFLLFGIPIVLSFYSAFSLSSSFLLANLAVSLPLLVIGGSIGVSLALLFVNLVPRVRLTDVIGVAIFALVLLLLLFEQGVRVNLPAGHSNSRTVATSIIEVGRPPAVFSPGRWAAEVVEGYLTHSTGTFWPALLLLYIAAAAAIGVGFLLFDTLFWRGWNLVSERSRKEHIASSPLRRKLVHALFPFAPQFRAIALKEGRMFARDTAQSLQLLFILVVTCLYIYNFRTLRFVSSLGSESHNWLRVLLSVINIGFGASVVAAVAARFVYPSISLEGRAYALIRSAPLSLERYLRYKLITWLVPLSVLAAALIGTGASALELSPVAIWCSVLVGLPLAGSVVAIATGIGAVYARFDWDSPAQVTSSFGGIVHMALSLMTIGLSALPASYIFILLLVPNFSATMGGISFGVSMFCALFLVYYIPFAAARQVLRAGSQSLRDLER